MTLLDTRNSSAPAESDVQAAVSPSMARARKNPPILIVPGLDNSGPAHWQSDWERSLPGAERVEQSDWANPTLSEWTANLAEAILRKPGVVLVAHSLGCALTAHFARVTGGRGVAAALLVAPADVDRSTIRGRLMDEFSPMPRRLLPFASTVVASRTDPFVDLARARTFAGDWGSRFTDLGDAGHINVDSGHGPWAEGRRLLDALIHQAASLQHQVS